MENEIKLRVEKFKASLFVTGITNPLRVHYKPDQYIEWFYRICVQECEGDGFQHKKPCIVNPKPC